MCLVLSYYVFLRSEFRVMMSIMISAYKTMFSSSLPPVVCVRAHVLFTLFVLVCIYWCPTHIVLCFCFVFLCDLCTLCCKFLWIVDFLLPLRCSLTLIIIEIQGVGKVMSLFGIQHHQFLFRKCQI